MGKRKPLAALNGDTVGDEAEHRAVKREKASHNEADPGDDAESTQQEANQRRVLRYQYLAVKNLINDEKEELYSCNSEKFHTIIKEVEHLHQKVRKPREQVADAEALLDIANTLVTSVRSQSKDGITPSDFISCLFRNFSDSNQRRDSDNDSISVQWKKIGLFVSPIFRTGHGCCTMVGPMKSELKERKVTVRRRSARATGCSATPQELGNTREEKTDTDKNMTVMFDILRRNKCVRLENLALNRRSFAQTVENLFALSFLVKDGRAEIAVDDKGNHLVSPRNAPGANTIASRDVVYHHFVFRFDFKDWKSMNATVPLGQELMPHRVQISMVACQVEPESLASQGTVTVARR
ncbi:hypothetical protein Ancab_000060 [Ancistrocladus abbreviatus]